MSTAEAPYFIGGDFNGMKVGETQLAAVAERSIIGVDDRHHDYMVRARMGLTRDPNDPQANPENNFWPIWPPEYEGRIGDPVLASHAGWAMKENWETARSYEQKAAANSAAHDSGKGVLTFIGGDHDGLRIGPFLSESRHSQSELIAGMWYEFAHKDAVSAIRLALQSGN